MSEMNQIASKHLGQQGSYAVYTEQFDPSLLVPMPRNIAREEWGIKGNEFKGIDVWHCHEATFLLDSGMPVAGTLKVIVPANSEFMVESKSFKLYLNTFDMCKMGKDTKEAIRKYKEQIKQDISACTNSEVEVDFFLYQKPEVDSFEDYRDMQESLIYSVEEDRMIRIEDIEITDYQGAGNHLKFVPKDTDGEYKVYTTVLRSRCRHTKQKDTGTAFFRIATKKAALDIPSLLKEVIALREVNEFHEFCAEKLYMAIASHPEVDHCTVSLMYARRGSLDICPVRSTSHFFIPNGLQRVGIYDKKTMGQ